VFGIARKKWNASSIRKGMGNRNKKVTVKFTLEQATRAQRGSRGIALLFL
jgi:CHASE1-domain containing sensor protein